MGRPLGRRGIQNSHLNFGDAKENPFRAWDVRGGLGWAGVSRKHGSGPDGRSAKLGGRYFRGENASSTRRHPAESTNREAGARTKGAGPQTTSDTARLPAPESERRARHRPGDRLGRRRRRAGSGLFAPSPCTLSAGRVSLRLCQLAGPLPRDGAISACAQCPSGRPGCLAWTCRDRSKSSGAFLLQHHQLRGAY